MENFADTMKTIFFDIDCSKKTIEKIYSKRVQENVDQMKDKSLKAKDSAKKRRSQPETKEEEMQPQCERNANAMLWNEMKWNEKKKKK